MNHLTTYKLFESVSYLDEIESTCKDILQELFDVNIKCIIKTIESTTKYKYKFNPSVYIESEPNIHTQVKIRTDDLIDSVYIELFLPLKFIYPRERKNINIMEYIERLTDYLESEGFDLSKKMSNLQKISVYPRFLFPVDKISNTKEDRYIVWYLFEKNKSK